MSAANFETCQIEEIQATVLGFLTDKGSIQRQVLVDDGRGGLKPSNSNNPWPTIQSNVSCRADIARIRSSERFNDNRLTSEGEFDVSFLAGTDIRNADRVVITTLDNRVFNLLGPRYASDEILRVMAANEIT